MFRSNSLLQRVPALRRAAYGNRDRTSSRAVARAFSSDGKLSYDVVPKEDFGQYKEYSVIHTNRSLNLMSDPFQRVMRNLNDLLKETYNADKVAIIPG